MVPIQTTSRKINYIKYLNLSFASLQWGVPWHLWHPLDPPLHTYIQTCTTHTHKTHTHTHANTHTVGYFCSIPVLATLALVYVRDYHSEEGRHEFMTGL